jgi:NOL1/NOP2/fmu family ribosome biogenesis protein
VTDEGDGRGAGDQADTTDDEADTTGDDQRENDGQRFERLPATPDEREVEGRPSREAVLDFWAERYGVPPGTFADHTFWEKGAGKVWAFSGEARNPNEVEALGLTFLRVRQEHWKPTTDAAQRFGPEATRNVIDLSPEQARRFVAGEDQKLDWAGDWGYLIAAHELAGHREPIGVGLYLHGELRSRVPKGRRRNVG